jgi:hypothetical protein
MSSARLTAALLLAGALLLGFAQIALLPPWEGFDETAHYSYIQQLAETGRWPRFGDPVSRDIEDYLRAIPSVGYAPWNYPALFAGSDDAIETARRVIKSAPAQERSWNPGEGPNWEAQHPPLYYAAMTPFYWMSRSWSLAHQLFFLRGVSYLLAVCGLWLAAALSAQTRRTADPQAALFSVCLWPVLFPMWFPEMARLGNDSLIVAIAACAIWLMRQITSGQATYRHHVLLGLVIGAGLLTKATFLPFAAAMLVILLVQSYGGRRDVRTFASHLKGLVVSGAVAAMICGWWYLGKLFETGNIVGSNDLAHVATGHGSPGPISEANPDLLAKVPWLFVQTFLWFGTWSNALPPRVLTFALLTTSAVLALGAIGFVWRKGLDAAGWLALLTLAFFLAALAYIAIATAGGTGGATYYLHAFAPVLAPLVAYGLLGLRNMKHGRAALRIVLLFPPGFLMLATAVNAFAYAGCGVRLANSMYYGFASMAYCAANLETVGHHLAVLSFPALSLPLFLAGWAASFAGIIAALRTLARSPQPSITSTR